LWSGRWWSGEGGISTDGGQRHQNAEARLESIHELWAFGPIVPNEGSAIPCAWHFWDSNRYKCNAKWSDIGNRLDLRSRRIEHERVPGGCETTWYQTIHGQSIQRLPVVEIDRYLQEHALERESEPFLKNFELIGRTSDWMPRLEPS
jgi:hypothetical protein